MRNGEKIWYCLRNSEANAEIDTYEKPIEEIVRMPSIFSRKSITVQPMSGYTDRMAYGETTRERQRIILTPYEEWHGKFKEGDLFYLDGQKPNKDEENYGENANYCVDSVGNQNYAIELIVKKIIDK